MKIAIIGLLHRKYDKRVYKTVEVASKYFDYVHYIYWTENKTETSYEEGNIEYIPIYHELKKNKIIELPYRAKYELRVISATSKIEADIFYIHHFATVFPKLIYKHLKKKNTIVITDFHEYVPEEYMLSLRHIIPVEFIGEKVFKSIILFSDKAVTVSRYVADRIKDIKPDIPVLVVPNYATYYIEDCNIKDKMNRKEVIFVGARMRMMRNEISILKELWKMGFKITFIGVKPEKDLNFIKSEPFLPYRKMIRRISKSTFSMVSFSPYDRKGKILKTYKYSLPNKFFDSLAALTPVLIRPEYTEMLEYVEKFRVGIVIDPNNVEFSVNKILQAYEKLPNFIENIKSNLDKFVWNEHKENQLVRFIVES